MKIVYMKYVFTLSTTQIIMVTTLSYCVDCPILPNVSHVVVFISDHWFNVTCPYGRLAPNSALANETHASPSIWMHYSQTQVKS